MGQEGDGLDRITPFLPYQVNADAARPAPRRTRSCCTACPRTGARRSPTRCSTGRSSAVFDQAENRLHAQKALLTCCWPDWTAGASRRGAADDRPADPGRPARPDRRADPGQGDPLADRAGRPARRRRRPGHPGHPLPGPGGAGRGQGARRRRAGGLPDPGGRPAPAARRRGGARPGWSGCCASCSTGSTPAATSPCCVPRRAPPSTWPARWTGRACPRSSAPSPATTPSSSWPARPSAGPRSATSSPAGPAGKTTLKGAHTMTERVVLAYSGGLDTSVAIPVPGRADRRRGDRGGGRRRPGRRGPGRHPAARAGLRRRRVRGGRRARRVRRRLLPAGDPGQRALHGPLPAGLRAVPAADRQAPGRRGRASTAARSSRTAAPARATTRSASRSAWARSPPTSRSSRRPGTSPGPGTRRSPSPRRRACRSTCRPSRRTRSTRTCGAARWRPASSRTSGTRPIEDLYSYTADPAEPRDADEVVITFDAGRAGRDRRRDGHPVPGDPGAEPARRRAGRRPARHGRGPAGRHQEPRGVRGARARSR